MLRDTQGLTQEQIEFWEFASNPVIDGLPKQRPATFQEIQAKFQIWPQSICNGLIRTSKRLEWKPHASNCSDNYLSAVDCISLNSWAEEHYQSLDAVRTIEVQQKALEIKIARYFNAIKELCLIAHGELANKIYEETQRLSLPSRSWVNVWAARNGFRVAKAKEIALERIKAANPDLIKNWLLFYEELFNRDARLLYNADETFLNFKRDYRSIACGLANPVTPEDKGSHMTVMVCFS